MARVLFQRPVRIDGTPYEAGREHELAPALVGHWYVKALVKDGQARIIDDPEPKPEPVAAPVAPKVEAKVEPVVKAAPVPKPAPVKPAAVKQQPKKTATKRGRR